MKCQICNIENATETITVLNETFNLCGFDALKLRTFAHGMVYHEVININWGAGRLDFGSWMNIRNTLRQYNIKEVLELGIGLSTELFVNEGMQVTGFDVYSTHVKVTEQLNPIKPFITLHNYDEVQIGESDPSTKFVQNIYPGRKWDFVFVDGPHVRTNEVREAMEVSNRFIYLHDPNLGEQSFFPNDQWKLVNHKLYEKVI